MSRGTALRWLVPRPEVSGGTSKANFVACTSVGDPPHIPDELPDRRHVYRRDGHPVRAKIKRTSGEYIGFYRMVYSATEIG